MMENVFLRIFNMSITATWIALAVIVLRLILKKAPKWIRIVLWGLVAIRLICPFSIESVLSIIPSIETIPQEIISSDTPSINSGVPLINQTINPIISESFTHNHNENFVKIIIIVAMSLWIIGMTAMLTYSVISFTRIRRRVAESIKNENGIWICDRISTPFILGIVRPKIFMPSSINDADINYVLSHEKAHLNRKDYIWKPIGFLLLTVYWFNPVMWIAYILLCRDIELACDEKVIKEMGTDVKRPYSDALINCSVPRKMITACPLAFGEVGVKGRIKSVLNYKKPAFWIIIIAVVACVFAALCLLTNPLSTKVDDKLSDFLETTILEQHKSKYTENYTVGIDSKILGVKKSGSETVVYTWVLYEEYNSPDNLKEESGSHIPTVITVKKDGDNYKLDEYWIPRDGSEYVKDIRRKFPILLWSKAIDSQWCISEQQENCKKYAKEHSENLITDTDVTKNSSESVDYTIYNFGGSPDPANPALKLDYNSNSFVFSWSVFSSYFAHGKFTLDNDILTCLTEDGKYKYIFKQVNDNFIFNAEKSSEIPKYKYSGSSENQESPVKDGDEFIKTEKQGFNPYFNATVLEVKDDWVIVEPFKDAQIRKSSDKIAVSKKVISTNPVPELKEGTEIRIVYNGQVSESYPAQITGVFAIYLLSDLN